MHRDELRPILAARLATGSSAAWLARLAEAEVPAGPINDILSALHHPQAVARGTVAELDHPVLGRVRQVGPPFALSATPASVRTPPPLLGEQTDEVLAELGYGAAEVEALHRACVL